MNSADVLIRYFKKPKHINILLDAKNNNKYWFWAKVNGHC